MLNTLTTEEIRIKDLLAEEGVNAGAGTMLQSLLKPLANYSMTLLETEQSLINNLDINTSSDELARVSLANLGLVIEDNKASKGRLIIITNTSDDVTISANRMFSAGGVIISLDKDVIATKDYAESLNDLYVPMYVYNDSSYYFIVEATIEEGTLVKDQIVDTDGAIAGVKQVLVYSGFYSANTKQTIQDLKEQRLDGMIAKTLGNREQTIALLRQASLNVIDASIIGIGDDALLRDKANNFGISQGGHVDIYVRTSKYPQELSVTKTAISLGNNKFKILVNKDDFPACSSAVAFRTSSNTVTDFTRVTQGVDITNERVIPQYTENEHCSLSCLQTLELLFDMDETVAENETITGELILKGMPEVGAVKAYLEDPARRSPFLDILVKAFHNIELNIELAISHSAVELPENVSEIQNIVADYANSVPASQGFISGTEIAHAVMAAFPKLIVLSPVIFTGAFDDYSIDINPMRSTDVIRIPDQVGEVCTKGTTVFSVNPDKVQITFKGDRY